MCTSFEPLRNGVWSYKDVFFTDKRWILIIFQKFWDLGVQIARSPRPEGVRRCPIACWKATFMYFMEI